MKFTTTILLVTLVASMSAYKLRADDGVNTENDTAKDVKVADTSSATASTGACNAGSCGRCDKDGDAKYCSICYKKNISGTGKNQKCDGAAPTGCLATMVNNDKATCVGCDDKNNYQMVDSECVKCDLSANYLSGKDCKPVETKVSNCATYASTGDCQSCKAGYQLQEKACNALPKGCAYMNADKKCTICSNGFTPTDDKGTCPDNKVSNCERVVSDDNTKCATCKSGYYVKDGACAKIGVSNCAEGSESKCDECKEGYLLKSDGSACTSSSSCLAAVYTSAIQCIQCNVEKGYFATDVKGDSKLDYDNKKFWEQVCTKFSKIAASAIVSIVALTLF